MAMLKSKSSHDKSCKRIKDALSFDGDRNRILAFDCVNLGAPETAVHDWADMMDFTRRISETNADWHGKCCVTYQHFLISPDPKDNITLEELRDITMEWVREFFGDWDEPGKLGSFEVAVIYHDDNDNRILHSHVIVNNANLDNARRLQINKSRNKELTDRLQDLCKDRGLSYFDKDEPGKIPQMSPRLLTSAERKILREGGFSWKQDISNRIVIAQSISICEEEFSWTLGRIGVSVELRENDYLFAHYHDRERWKVTGHRLGRNYERDSITGKLGKNMERYGDTLETLRRNVLESLELPIPADLDSSEVMRRANRADEIALMLKVNACYRIQSLSDYDERLGFYEDRLKAAGEERVKDRCPKAISSLRSAKAVAAEIGLFEGAVLPKIECAAPSGKHGSRG